MISLLHWFPHVLWRWTCLKSGIWCLLLWLVIVNPSVFYYTLCRPGNNIFIVMIVGYAGALAVCLYKPSHMSKSSKFMTCY